jgi:hypothetical protein
LFKARRKLQRKADPVAPKCAITARRKTDCSMTAKILDYGLLFRKWVFNIQKTPVEILELVLEEVIPERLRRERLLAVSLWMDRRRRSMHV